MKNENGKSAYTKALINLLDHQTKVPVKVFLSSYFPGFEIDQQTTLLAELKKKKLIKSFTWEDGDFVITKPSRSGILEFLYKTERAGIEQKETSLTDNKIRFNTETGIISTGVRICEIPINTNQYFLCKTVFAVPFGTLIKEIDILDSMDWAKETKDGVYDAMRAVNKKIKLKLGIHKFLKWKVRRIFIDYKTE
ncbi:MAG: hypothetical protein PHR47_00495 [Candidatus Pacebacteria bacterium]|nr:hypothetical protein [Candidatus Paceibacterota bacterium]